MLELRAFTYDGRTRDDIGFVLVRYSVPFNTKPLLVVIDKFTANEGNPDVGNFWRAFGLTNILPTCVNCLRVPR